ncbi:glycoside hydrolase [Niastella yeongjuensis]|uniref:Glycoside hydrolase n=1 Tax=Niastella yeongjuensis TaxID=354355 RepID=A0A1V9EPC5_9BACT|nr:SUMF1/EgtB/PvdO family nonheme iron enzyme [Niastella yeongjuensis]OQP47735.1 glycoside hydrolase [Niastella yeongjuensis]SEP45598.1 Formylglycine-generating enzyme, required for sulfatase activity, contains SUMF1/FGE domain [Niastella yeongjuensis]
MFVRWLVLFSLFLFHTCLQSVAQQKNALGIQLINIQSGTFNMGSERGKEDADEYPVHAVTITKGFRMSATEITNKQYEAFDPEHKKLRGKHGFSLKDDEAVVFVSYEEAVAFCAWLSRREGKPYRLPTEAEWEYACRAGTNTDYFTGNELPAEYQKLQHTNRTPVPVSLQVAQTAPNGWGLYDMHGNVEEWCHDWYGAYVAGEQTDPVGGQTGMSRVTRGGSHNTPVRYLRSANRQGMLPDDKHWLTGFRIVQGALPRTKALPAMPTPANSVQVSQQKYVWLKDTAALFETPITYIIRPDSSAGIPFYKHNHCPAITWCPNGDLLAAWFTTNAESGREMAILASRLRAGKKTWDTASLFFMVPDRNTTGTSLLYDKKGTLYHLNGLEAAGDWQNLAIVMRTSTNNGTTWSKPQLIEPEHGKRHQVIAGAQVTREGWLVQFCDADPGSRGGTAMYISKDKGTHWTTPYSLPVTPRYKDGAMGGLIAGIHASAVQLKDGRWFALGRNDNIKVDSVVGDRMPMSISTDGGANWQYAPSIFPPISSGQRLVLRRLNEGPLLMISFTHCPGKSAVEGMDFTKPNGEIYKGYGMYAALSYDEGKTWPVIKLLSDGHMRQLNGGAWTGMFRMDSTHAEPKGYLAATQTPDNIIHLLSSNLYYRFTLAWLQQP